MDASYVFQLFHLRGDVQSQAYKPRDACLKTWLRTGRALNLWPVLYLSGLQPLSPAARYNAVAERETELCQ